MTVELASDIPIGLIDAVEKLLRVHILHETRIEERFGGFESLGPDLDAAAIANSKWA